MVTNEVLHGPLPIDVGDDDIACFRGGALFDQNHVVGVDACFNHGIASHLEHEGGFGALNKKFVETEGVDQFFFCRRGKSGLNRSKQLDVTGQLSREGNLAALFNDVSQGRQALDALENRVL